MKKTAPVAPPLQLVIAVNDRPMYWEIGPDGRCGNLQALSAPTAVRVSDQDHRLMVGKRNLKAVQRTAVKTVAGIPVFLAGKNARYFTHIGQIHVADSQVRAIPALRLLDVARQNSALALPALQGLYLGGHPDVLVVWAIHKDGNSSKPRVFLDVGGQANFDKPLRLVAGDNNFTDQYNVQVLDGGDLRRLFDSDRRLRQPYPLDSEWHGLSLPLLRSLLLAGAAALAVSGIGFATAQKALERTAESSLSAAPDPLPTPLALERLQGFAQAGSLDIDAGLAAARTVWVPGSQATLHMKLGMPTVLTLVLDLRTSEGGDEDIKGADLLKALLSQAAPAGYQRSKVQVSPTGEQYVVTFTETRSKPRG